MGRPLRVYSLRDDDLDDIDTIYFDADERAELKRLGISDGRRGLQYIDIPVIWDTDSAKDRTLYKGEAVYTAEAICYIRQGDLPRRPKANELLIVDNIKYDILRCTENSGILELILVTGRS